MRFQRDPVAFLDAPRAACLRTDFMNDADRFVAGDDRVPHNALLGEVTFVLLDVAAAQTAGLDPQ